MKAALERFARRWWAGQGGASGRLLNVLSAPVAWMYSAGVAWRNRRYDRMGGIAVEGLAVISVGNLAVGGTGKTPVSGWIVGRVLAAGKRPALVSRGYASDELALHRRWHPEVPVVADTDRVAAARRAQAEGAQVAVLDDAFQHRRLARDLDVVLLAAEDGFPGRTLPRGPFREPAGSLERADIVLVTRRTAAAGQAATLAEAVARRFPSTEVAVLHLAPGRWQDLQGHPAEAPEGPVLAAAAVARPRDFAANVEAALGERVALAAHPDHHEYSAADVRALRRRAGSRTVVVTEKDAVKLVEHADALGPARVLSQELRWEGGRDVVEALLSATIDGV